MTLYINTADQEQVIIALRDGNKIVKQSTFKASRSQAEKLLPAIEKLLKSTHSKLTDLKKIEVANFGGSFTALRIGVITANALGYALSIPVVSESLRGVKKFKKISVVEPAYDRPPNIGK
jgi:tRNA threonylcarbamoyl adenosine modification protein YeaZ